MADVVSKETRSRMMSGIRSKNTKPEIAIRKKLYAAGFRYRTHYKGLPGKPDLVFPKHKTALFVHGCFWHAHNCKFFKWPKSNVFWWKTKLEGNKQRDIKKTQAILALGWSVIIVYECALKKENEISKLINTIQDEITTSEQLFCKHAYENSNQELISYYKHNT